MPYEVNRVPDWYGPLLTSLGIPSSLVKGRSFGIAQTVPGVAQTSVDFLIIDATGGVYANVTVLGNPIPVFDNTSAGQTLLTCPPFASTVNTSGLSSAVAWSCTHAAVPPVVTVGTYDASAFTSSCTPAGGAAGSGTGPGPGGVVLSTVNNTVCTTCNYEIAISSGYNLDGDATGGGIQLYNSQDNCALNANGTQADANSNGIGDACKGGGAWANASASAITNASFTCDLSDADHTPLTAPTGGVGSHWAKCQDADQDGALNTVDNCPLTANPTQLDSIRDGVGDACRPIPGSNPDAGAIGTGTGYAPGTLTGITSVGTVKDFDDICNAPFTIGTGAGTASCLDIAAGTYAIFAPPIAVPGSGQVLTFTTAGALAGVDSNDNAIPDFLDLGSGNDCLGDHNADANHDGYSDFDEATQRSTTPGCNAASYKKPTAAGITAVTSDPIANCAGRNSKGSAAQIAAAKKAKSDVDLDGKTTILDISAAAGSFGSSILGATDKRAEYNQDTDSKVTILDISAMAANFGVTVPSC